MTATVEIVNKIEPHPTRKLLVVTIGDKTYVTRKPFEVGESCIVIHSNSILPNTTQWKKYNRLIKVEHRHGIKTYGILLKNKFNYSGDVSDKLGITEYQGYLVHNKKGELRESYS